MLYHCKLPHTTCLPTITSPAYMPPACTCACAYPHLNSSLSCLAASSIAPSCSFLLCSWKFLHFMGLRTSLNKSDWRRGGIRGGWWVVLVWRARCGFSRCLHLSYGAGAPATRVYAGACAHFPAGGSFACRIRGHAAASGIAERRCCCHWRRWRTEGAGAWRRLRAAAGGAWVAAASTAAAPLDLPRLFLS